MEEQLERIVLRIPEVFVYQIPPRESTGHVYVNMCNTSNDSIEQKDGRNLSGKDDYMSLDVEIFVSSDYWS